ncbi:hypothetical protein ACE1OA_25120 [Streptomyces sp. JL2001]|uniref:hypothetical protein n=1 Tax=Streptomyces sp. JL2001 TaxID=3342488 RepID=UPI003D806447
MSGSLWLRNGTMRDTLPYVPRPRPAGRPAGTPRGLPHARRVAPEAPPATGRDTALPPYGRGDGPPGRRLPAGREAATNRCAPAHGAPGSPGPGSTRTSTALAPDPLDELAERLDALTAVAVHPDEIAAILESDGMTDDHIRLTYGRADSFALAEDLYARLERRHPGPEAAGESGGPWHGELAGCLLRGLLFALPGLAYVLGAPLLAGPRGAHGLPAGTIPLLAGAVVGWVWNQTLSHRAYCRLGLGDRRAALRALAVGAPSGALAGTLVALAAALATGPVGLPAMAFAAGQSLYLAAATVLLVLGRERALLGALLPLAGAVPAFHHDLPHPLRTGLLLASLAATTACAVNVLGPGLRGGPKDGTAGAAHPARTARSPRAGGAPPLAASLPYGLFGLGTGLLVLYTAVGDVLAAGPAAAVAAPSAVALTLSMGPAEWLLHRFRSESLAGLRTLTSAHAFARATTVTLALCLGAYLACLLALASVGTLLWPDAPRLTGPRLVSLLLVGVVLWLGLLLQAFGAVRAAAVVCAIAAAAQILAPAAAPAVAGGAAAVLTVLARVLLVRPTAHRS